MAGSKVLIIGCGSIGSATARILAGDGTFDHILLADRERGKGAALAQELGLRVSATGLDVPDVDALLAAVREAHASGETVVLNATGPFTQDTLGIIDTVVRIGAAYADVNDEAGVLSKVFDSQDLDTLARNQGVAVLPGLGASPGQTNVVARYLADRMNRVDEIRFFLVNDVRYRSQAVWLHRFTLFGGPAAVYQDGGWTQVQAMSAFEDVQFPEPWGAIRCYAVGLEPVSLPGYFKGLKHASMMRGFLHPIMATTLKGFIELGLTGQQPVQVGSMEVVPADFAAAFLTAANSDHLFNIEGLPDRLPREVRVSGVKGGRRCALTASYSYPSMQLPVATASCLAVGARMLLRKETPGPGVLPPEALPPDPFIKDMESQGSLLTVEESEDLYR